MKKLHLCLERVLIEKITWIGNNVIRAIQSEKNSSKSNRTFTAHFGFNDPHILHLMCFNLRT